MPCDLHHELDLAREAAAPVCGIDEAGRGPLAGPLAVASVILPKGFSLPGLDDSKKLTERKRDRIFAALVADPSIRWHCEIIGIEEIDRLNILGATRAGMRKAALAVEAAAALIDGLPVPNFPLPQRALVGGDGLSLSIAAASVIAKVTRDRIMVEMDRRFPQYGFAKHKGYGTKEHLLALETYGPTPIHRRSFAPVAQATLGFGGSRLQ